MSRGKKKLAALAVFLSVGFVSLGFVANRLFAWPHQILPPVLLGFVARAPVHNITIAAGVKAGDSSLLPRYAEPTDDFLGMRGNRLISFRSAANEWCLLKTKVTCKVARYISKSVLNI